MAKTIWSRTWSVMLLIMLAVGSVGCGTTPATAVPTAVPPPNETAKPPVSDYSGQLVISTWGGTTEEWVRDHVEPVFKQTYPNVTVVYDIGGMSARYNKLLAQKESPEINLFFTTAEFLFAARDAGLLSPLNRDNIPNMQYLEDWALADPNYGVGFAAIALGLGYNPDFFGTNPPTSWQDLWRPEVQGKIAVPAIGHSMMPQFIITAAELNGGSQDNIDPGFAYLAELKPAAQAFFYTDWNAQFDSGDIVLAADFDYFINYMADTGSNIKWVIPKEGTFGSLEGVAIVKGTENQEVAEAFINTMLSAEVQLSAALDLLNSPARKGVVVPADVAQKLAAYGSAASSVIWLDPAFAVKSRPQWTEFMNELVAPAWAK
jgi:putative spermidine/putrescine transport system substrate-binding protein